ncbi:MAG TPA: 4-alpha-glucanotransferase, partial [Anaerovoracaceae bacterium]|nr:4-alpha-glucanotransferase [Anaerovoracaceae bacterium]
MKRSSGILLPIFSLPSRQGIGTLGQEAYNFLDFLNASGQSHWQMLPVGPTGFGDSPYQCFSSHAGNPYFIDLDLLVSEGLLKQREVDELQWGSIPDKVDYGIIYKNKNVILKKAFDRFLGICGQESTRYCKFCEENLDWLADYALFISLKQHFNMLPWYEWDGNIRRRYPAALERYKELLKDQIEFHMFVQYIFYSQWEMMQLYAKEKKVNLIGDLPIYIPMDSADAWVESDILQFDEEGNPTAVGGVPPDYFSKTGQLWGNPLYDWKKIKDSGYIWWMKRLASAAKLFDCIRLDHFRGFESYY